MVCAGRLALPTPAELRCSGPIIRISPYELHIDEPDYYEELYSQHKPRNKSPFYLNQFDLPGSGFGTADHRLHRARRAALNPFFSKQTIARLQPMLTFMIEKLCSRIEEFRKSGQPMPMRQVFMCLTTDVVTLYALNRSWNHLDSPDFSPVWGGDDQSDSCSGTYNEAISMDLSCYSSASSKRCWRDESGNAPASGFSRSLSLHHPAPSHATWTKLTEPRARESKKTRKRSSMESTNPAKSNMNSASTGLFFMPFWSRISHGKRSYSRACGRKDRL